MRLYFRFLAMHLKSRMAYKKSFFFSIVGQFLTSFSAFLALWFLLALYGSQSAVGGLLLGMEESSGYHEDCRCKHRSASLIGSFLYVSCLRCRSLL